MTVLPFTSPASVRKDSGGEVTATDHAAMPDVVGRFASPTGGHGGFTGTYRLERLVDQYGQTAAAGVFTGELVGADGQQVGLASRRHVAAAEVVEDSHGCYAALGPVDVNLLGLLVSVEPFTVAVPRRLLDPAAAYPSTTAELMDLVVGSVSHAPTADRPLGGRGW